MKKILTALIALGLVFSLAACSSDKGSGLSAEDIKNADRVTEGTIEIYAPAGKNTDYLLAAMDLYNEEFGTNLVLNPVDVAPADPMVQKITPMLVAKEKMPELIFLQDANAGAIFNKFQDSFYSSEDLGFIAEHGSKFYEAKMNMLANIAPDGKTYGYPNDWGNSAMFYNDAAFKEAGVDMADVKTWDDLIEAGIKLKAATGRKLVFMRDTGELDLVYSLTEQQGLSLLDKDGNLNLTQPEVVKSYEIIQRLIDEDLVAFGPSADYSKIGQENGLGIYGGWMASYQATDFPEDEGDIRIGQLPTVIDGQNISPMSGGSSFYVLKNSDNAIAAHQFITYALTNMDSLQGYMNLMGFPANTEAYETEAAQKEFPYYGNQKILLELNEISKNSINGYVFPYSSDLRTYVEQTSNDIQHKGMDVKEALEKNANEFADKYGIKVND